MEESKKALIVFQKNPVLGKVKTRLAATVGEAKALEIYMLLLQHTYKVINQLEAIDTFIYFSDQVENDLEEIFVDRVKFNVQNGLDLGSRMKNAFEEIFQQGYDQVTIIGTDCPEITVELIYQAFETLDYSDTVFGPARDGGYYLLGMNQFIPHLFEQMIWSHDRVLMDSIKKLDLNRNSFTLLEMLSDIDNEADWIKYKKTLSQTI
ncbi:TIGR04282 family arsenosugar biosynthesis glycosyltransferase [Belliella pelovolcani]|uniref:TIGR04282 family arsenosugar biosynthesis glycosyltransferase n=1 Tax=Belliella pelovolcani TaxID=529505 RepID=UPI00391B3B87